MVLDTNKQPLDPTTPANARRLLSTKQASVFKMFPFTIILHKEIKETVTPSVELKLDPGSKVTGIALVKDDKIIWGADLKHRGSLISDSLTSRRQIRSGRRARHTWYRPARFDNRTKPQGWLPPSINHRVQTTMTWVNKLIKLASIKTIYQELVSFDTQKMANPDIMKNEYQQGTLQGYTIKEYLLEKWNRKCAYCDASNTKLEVEHIIPRSKGGTNSITNLCLACRKCNDTKDNLSIKEFLSNKPAKLKQILAQCKATLKDAAAVNSSKQKLLEQLQSTNIQVITGTGVETKYNRINSNLDKEHWIDAGCVGTDKIITLGTQQSLKIDSKGHGNRQFVRMNKFGFPATKARQKYDIGWVTGDFAKAIITTGKYIGTYTGRICVNSETSLYIRKDKIKIGGKLNCFTKLFSSDGYNYSY